MLRPLLRVEPGERLVEDQEVGAAEQRLGDRETSLHSAAQRADAIVGDIAQSDRSSAHVVQRRRSRAESISFRAPT